MSKRIRPTTTRWTSNSKMNLPRPLPPAGAAHPLGGTVYSRSAARSIIRHRWATERPNDSEAFIRQCFGVRWLGDQDRDATIAAWIDPAECPF